MSRMDGRHYGMDWLRIGAFQLLILYHVGMAFVPWDYQVKVVSPALNWASIPMLLTNPWRLSLLFAVSGYSSAAMFARQEGGVAAFLRSRVARLGIPLLFGMAVIVTPQPWIWLITHYGYAYGFGHFIIHDYYRFQMIDGIAMPTWMQLWFVVYLLGYTMVLGALLALPKTWQSFARRAAEAVLATPALLPLGIIFIYFERAYLYPGWEDTHWFVGDWAAHAMYMPIFLFGALLRKSEALSETIGRWWPVAAVVGFLGWIVLAGFEIAYPGNMLAPRVLWPWHNLARAVEAWGAIIALIGVADRYLNVDSKWRPVLAEAVFPFYLIHQTIILVVGYWLLPTMTGPLARFLILVVATAGGCWVFYLVGREINWLRPLIGLKTRKAPRRAALGPAS